MNRLKAWYLSLSLSGKLLFSFTMQYIYWFFACIFYDKMINDDARPLYQIFLMAFMYAVAITAVFEWRKIRSLFEKKK